MLPHMPPRRALSGRSCRPVVETLETRQLLSFGSLFSSTAFSQERASSTAIVRHAYDVYVGELKAIELKSQATPAEYLVLRDDARAISEAASAALVGPSVARNKAVEVSLQLDRSPLYGSLQDSGWATVSTRVTSNLQSLAIPQPLISRTIADMKTLAGSAGVTSVDFYAFTQDFNTLRDVESYYENANYRYRTYVHFDDPGLYYTQHLRGFFRGWAVEKTASATQLQADLRAIPADSGASAAGGERAAARRPSAGVARRPHSEHSERPA